MRTSLGEPVFSIHQLSKVVRNSLFLILSCEGAALTNTLIGRLKKLRSHLEDDEYSKYNLWLENNENIRYRSLLEAQNFQPLAAWIGLVLNFLIVFVFSTASWWRQPLSPTKFFAAYAGVSLLGFSIDQRTNTLPSRYHYYYFSLLGRSVTAFGRTSIGALWNSRMTGTL